MSTTFVKTTDGKTLNIEFPLFEELLPSKKFLLSDEGDGIYCPFPVIGGIFNVYDMIIDGELNPNEKTVGRDICGTGFFSSINDYIDKNWDEYNAIINNKGYTKEGGFDVQKVKEVLNKLHGINEPIENTPQIETEGNMTDKERMDSDTDITGRNPISEALKKFLSDGKPTEDDWYFQGKYEELGQFFVIRTLSFFIKDRVEKERVLEQIQKTFSGSSEEGMKYRDRLSGRQLWMTEYHDSRNFVLETQEEDSKSENKLRFVFSLGSVKVEDVFIHSDKEGTELDMDRAMEFL